MSDETFGSLKLVRSIVTAKCDKCGKPIRYIGGPIIGKWVHENEHEPEPKKGTEVRKDLP